ncbi:hypothetical protein [Mucilaginibacter defluvii]|uniref:Uncharacterized protein n=1 Tax=Mucilaginibacter defluvii TaxID=1196019 RepID=A0ABP9G0Z2_9SPHI
MKGLTLQMTIDAQTGAQGQPQATDIGAICNKIEEILQDFTSDEKPHKINIKISDNERPEKGQTADFLVAAHSRGEITTRNYWVEL